MFLELKRFIYNKYLLLVFGVFLILIGLSFVNVYIVQGYYSNNNAFVLDYYNVICQTSPFLMAPILGTYFAKDYELNIYRFYTNYNISKYQYCFYKLVTSALIIGIVEILFSMVFLRIMNIDFKLSMVVSFLLLLDLVYMIIMIDIVAHIVRKKMTTIFLTMAIVVVLSIINIIPLGPMTGKIFVLDANSYISALVTNFLNNNINDYGRIFAYLALYVLIAFGLYLFTILIGENNAKQYNSTR